MSTLFAPDFEIHEGVLVKYHGHAKVVHVPEGVTHIGEGAFTQLLELPMEWPPPMATWDGRDNPALDDTCEERIGFACIREVYLPTSLETIGQQAFRKCRNLKQVHVPATLRRIGKEAFAFCPALNEIVVPSNAILEDGVFFPYNVHVIRR